MTTPCPCGRPGALGVLTYDRCCGRYLDDPATPPPDPESLMRSRYTAYATGRADWLLATWDVSTRPRRVEIDPALEWAGLEVVASSEDGDVGRVQFVARWTEAGQPGVLREDSRFVRRGGSWFYVDGTLG
ncbi:MAG: YchJ family metal-binding protein [Kineosporiaceae bacterium]